MGGWALYANWKAYEVKRVRKGQVGAERALLFSVRYIVSMIIKNVTSKMTYQHNMKHFDVVHFMPLS